MTPEHLKQLLQRYGIKPNQTYGQNFLLNEIVLQDMVDSVPLKKGEAILEVGPGLGSLTEFLCRTGNPVVCVEKDAKFLPVLKALRKENKNLSFEISDILHFNFQEALNEFSNYHVVANIPYYITGKIIQLFVRATRKPKSITLLIQKEVAERLAAEPGDMSILAVSAQIYAKVSLGDVVPAELFTPPPKVDSQVVVLKTRDENLLEKFNRENYCQISEKEFFRVVKAGFSAKRKKISKALSGGLAISKEKTEQILAEAEISPDVRAQDIEIENWLKLAKVFFKKDKK